MDFTLHQLTEMLKPAQLPSSILHELWENSEILTAPPNTVFSHNKTLHNKLFFMIEGCAIDYSHSKKNERLIYRLIEAPIFITVSMFSRILDTEPHYIRETVSKIKGIAWDLDYIMNLAEEYPSIHLLFCQALGEILLSQAEVEIISAQLNSLDKYKWFLNKHPSLINQIPLKYIASYLKMRPETLSRVRSELVKTF